MILWRIFGGFYAYLVLLHLDIFSMIYSNYYLTPGESLKKSMKTNKLEDLKLLEN